MTAAEYARHPTLSRPFYRGMDAAAAGEQLKENPYRRRVARVRRPRRGSWSEGFSSAWASGWRHYHRATQFYQERGLGGAGRIRRALTGG